MTDLQQAGAALVESISDTPSSLEDLRRRVARRRRRVVAAGAVFLLVLVVGIAIPVSRNLNAHSRRINVGGGDTPAPSPTSSPVAPEAPACQSSSLQMKLSGGWIISGSAVTSGITFTNVGRTPCYVEGQPVIRFTNSQGQPLTIQEELAPSESTGSTKASLVPLPPGVADVAGNSLQWFNWCAADPGPLVVSVAVPTWGLLSVPGPSAGLLPRCTDPTLSSIVKVSNIYALPTPQSPGH